MGTCIFSIYGARTIENDGSINTDYFCFYYYYYHRIFFVLFRFTTVGRVLNINHRAAAAFWTGIQLARVAAERNEKEEFGGRRAGRDTTAGTHGVRFGG